MSQFPSFWTASLFLGDHFQRASWQRACPDVLTLRKFESKGGEAFEFRRIRLPGTPRATPRCICSTLRREMSRWKWPARRFPERGLFGPKSKFRLVFDTGIPAPLNEGIGGGGEVNSICGSIFPLFMGVVEHGIGGAPPPPPHGRGMYLQILGYLPHSFQGCFFLERLQKPRGNGQILKRRMAEKNAESSPRAKRNLHYTYLGFAPPLMEDGPFQFLAFS